MTQVREYLSVRICELSGSRCDPNKINFFIRGQITNDLGEIVKGMNESNVSINVAGFTGKEWNSTRCWEIHDRDDE